jgi:hypothetical protein
MRLLLFFACVSAYSFFITKRYKKDGFSFIFCLNFMPHQKKGGIHDIFRIFMETFGWFRLTGLLHQNIWALKRKQIPS